MNDVPELAPFVIDDDGVFSRRAFFTRVQHHARSLAGRVSVVLQAPTSTALLVSLLAAREQGVVPVLLSPRFPVGRAARAAAMAEAGLKRLSSDVREILADVSFTSGTTGIPRAVVHTRDGHDAVARVGNERTPFGPGDRWLLSLPLVHVGGLGIVSRALVGGGAVAVPRAGENLVHAALRLGATHVSVVRTQLVDILASTELPRLAQQLRAMLVGGGPVPVPLLEQAARHGLPVAQTWGMTETHAQIATATLGDVTTCGRPLSGRQVKVNDDGILCVRGLGLCAGTLDDNGLSPLPLDDDGFFVTGDCGRLEEEGRVIVTGRAGLRIVSGGEKIEPEAIEATLLQRPDIVDVVVVAVPHARWGERPVAFVRIRDDQTQLSPAAFLSSASSTFSSVTLSAWTSFLRAHLPSVWVPDAFLPWPDDVEPGKTARALLRERAASLA